MSRYGPAGSRTGWAAGLGIPPNHAWLR